MKTAVVSFLLLAVYSVAIFAAMAPRPLRPQYIDWSTHSETDRINGVFGKCRPYWIKHAQQRQQAMQSTLCPFGPFAADIVDHYDTDPANVHIDGWNCGKWIEGNTGERGAAKDPSLHAELEAIHRLMNCDIHPENCVLKNVTNPITGVTTLQLAQTRAQDKAWWQRLSLYSTGESCILDAAAEAYSGIREVIYGVPSSKQIEAGWPLFLLDSRDIYESALTPTLPFTIIANVAVEFLEPLYIWQFNTSVPCPAGCGRLTATSGCTKVA